MKVQELILGEINVVTLHQNGIDLRVDNNCKYKITPILILGYDFVFHAFDVIKFQF
jgi:hypothetical protein